MKVAVENLHELRKGPGKAITGDKQHQKIHNHTPALYQKPHPTHPPNSNATTTGGKCAREAAASSSP